MCPAPQRLLSLMNRPWASVSNRLLVSCARPSVATLNLMRPAQPGPAGPGTARPPRPAGLA